MLILEKEGTSRVPTDHMTMVFWDTVGVSVSDPNDSPRVQPAMQPQADQPIVEVPPSGRANTREADRGRRSRRRR